MTEKKVTIYSLAEELGVSIAAISRAFDPNSRLSKEKRKMILEAAEKYGYKPNRFASRLSLSPIRIGILNFSFIKEFYTEIVDGFNAAYRNLVDYKVSCSMHILQRGESTIEEALAILDKFEEEKMDGVIISGIYEDCIVEKINHLVDSGIRVATVQYSLSQSKRSFASLSDYPTIGKMAAELCGMLLRGNEKRNIVMFTGNQKSPTHQILSETFRQYSEPNGFSIVDIYDTHDDPICAEEMVKKAFIDHQDLGGIYASSANSLPICKYLSALESEKKIAFVASDVFPGLFPYIENKIIDATIYQDPFNMGYEAFDKMYHLIAEGTPVEDFIASVPRIVISSNLHSFH